MQQPTPTSRPPAAPFHTAAVSTGNGGVPQLVYVGAASYNSGVGAAQVTPPNMGGQAGAVWSPTPTALGSASFTFFIQSTTGNTGDCFCFVLQTTGTTALGGKGGSCGYTPNVFPSIAVCLRTYNGDQTIGAHAGTSLPYPDLAHQLPYSVTTGQAFNVTFQYAVAEGTVTYTLQAAGGGPVSMWTDVVGTVTSIFGSANPMVYAGITAGDGATWEGVFVSAFQPPPPPSLAAMALVGNAMYNPAVNTVQLTAPDAGSQSGAAWAPAPVPVTTAAFAFFIKSTTPYTGDGFCFVYQINGTDSLGGRGGECGYAPSVTPSIALCLLTYNSSQSIGAYTNAVIPSLKLAHPLPWSVTTGSTIYVTLAYSATAGTLTYTLLETGGGPSVSWTDTVGSLTPIFGTANPLVYAGVTASDGGEWQGVYITAFSAPATSATSG